VPVCSGSHLRGRRRRDRPCAGGKSIEARWSSGREGFWEIHELLFHRQKALEKADLRHYAALLGLDVARFDDDRQGMPSSSAFVETSTVERRPARCRGTPTLFIDGALHRGSYEVATLLNASAS
jgi:protein-disulfide isomerase